MTTAGSHAVNPISAQQHAFAIGSGTAPSAADPTRYLGPDQGILQTNPYDRVSHTNYDYPEAVKYSTLFVKSTIEGFIMEDIEWYTTVALPWAQTDQISVTWNEWHFDQHLADRVPHEGVSRLITSSKRQFKAHVVRRGLAFIQEADYAGTPEGEEQYARNVMSISQAVQETQNHDTVWALLSCKNYYKMWQQRFGTQQVSLRQITDAEINLFGSVNLPEGSQTLEVIIEDHKRIMSKKKVMPNMIILWPGAAIYMSMVPPMRTEYWKAGPDGVARRERGPDSISQFRGMPVFEARDFDVYDNSPPVQLLTRPIQVSEYYTMRFDRVSEDASDYTSKERGIVLYDENVDQWRKITFLEAFDHIRIFGNNGHYHDKLRDLVDDYKARGQKFSGDDSSMMRDDGRDDGGNNDDDNNTFFLTAPDNEGEAMLLRYFGQMELKHATEQHFQRIGETIAAKLGSMAVEAWHEMVQLVNDIESQPYVHEYWTALIAANIIDNVADDGVFVGELTPDDLAAHWGMRSKQVQWASNAYGSMRLPVTPAMRNIGYPAGFANIPGFRTLAEHANDPTSPWQSVGKRAKNALAYMQYMLDTLRNRMKDSAAFDEKSRSPWFHRPDALTTFFENAVLGVGRDPLFLSTLPVDSEGREELQSADTLRAEMELSKGMKWFVLPGTVVSLSDGQTLQGEGDGGIEELTNVIKADAENVVNLRDLEVVSLKTISKDPSEFRRNHVMIYSPTLRTVVSVPQSAFSHIRATPEVRAFGAMPGGDSAASQATRKSYYRVMEQIDDADTRRKFTDFVLQLGQVDPVQMWRAVYGLQAQSKSALAGAVNTLYIDETATKKEVAASKKFASELANIAPPPSEWKNEEPLITKWNIGMGTYSLGEDSGLAYDEIAEDIQRAFNLEREILDMTDIEDASFMTLDKTSISGALDGANVNAGNESDFEAARAELLSILARINRKIERTSFKPEEAIDYASRRGQRPKRGQRVGVVDTAAGVASGVYYRTPLTSSLHFLQSLSSVFGGRVGAKPLVLPSDPASGHTSYYDSGDTNKPTSLTRRQSYNPISAAISHAMNAGNYATMAELQRDSNLGSLDETPFIKRHAAANLASDNNTEYESAAGFSSKRPLFEEDIDGSDDEDSVMRVFSGAPMSKRSRMDIGAHTLPPNVTSIQAAHTAEHKLTRTGAFAERWAQANRIADPIVKVATRVFLLTRCDHAEVWRNMIKNDILIPLDIILWRAFITHDMASGILMKGGLETGANLHGGANVSKSHDGTSKLIYYNFTFRSKAVVWKEKNVVIMENIKFEGYVGGMSTEFVKSPRDLDREDVDRPSIIATAISMNEKPLAKMLDFSGKIQVPESNIRIDGPRKRLYGTADYYDKKIWNLSDRTVKRSPEHEDYFDRSDRVSIAAFQGTQYSYNRFSGRYSRFVEPQGHLKRNMCYPGAAAVLNGTAKSFVNYSYDTVMIE